MKIKTFIKDNPDPLKPKKKNIIPLVEEFEDDIDKSSQNYQGISIPKWRHIPVKDLEDSHLLNILKMIKVKNGFDDECDFYETEIAIVEPLTEEANKRGLDWRTYVFKK